VAELSFDRLYEYFAKVPSIQKNLIDAYGTDGKITLRSYLNLFNFKANHRKTLVVDTAQGWKTLVTSANPHDGSSSNMLKAVGLA
jgi:hypothetical protein